MWYNVLTWLKSCFANVIRHFISQRQRNMIRLMSWRLSVMTARAGFNNYYKHSMKFDRVYRRFVQKSNVGGNQIDNRVIKFPSLFFHFVQLKLFSLSSCKWTLVSKCFNSNGRKCLLRNKTKIPVTWNSMKWSILNFHVKLEERNYFVSGFFVQVNQG